MIFTLVKYSLFDLSVLYMYIGLNRKICQEGMGEIVLLKLNEISVKIEFEMIGTKYLLV